MARKRAPENNRPRHEEQEGPTVTILGIDQGTISDTLAPAVTLEELRRAELDDPGIPLSPQHLAGIRFGRLTGRAYAHAESTGWHTPERGGGFEYRTVLSDVSTPTLWSYRDDVAALTDKLAISHLEVEGK